MTTFRQTYVVDKKRRQAALEKLKLSQRANEPDATNDLPDAPEGGGTEAVFFGTPQRPRMPASHAAQAIPPSKALFMTVWRPSTRSAENSCGMRQG